MEALIALLPTILALLNNPAVKSILPLLLQLGGSAFPGVKPEDAAHAASALFDANGTKWVQTALNMLGAKIDVDGVYGEGTKTAVSNFQRAHGLEVDGWAGTKTADALRSALMEPTQEGA